MQPPSSPRRSRRAPALTAARHSPPHPARSPPSLLMAPGGGFSLPQLAGVPAAQRLIADDRLAVTLAESLVKLDIALHDDWKKAERDPTSYIRITLERWIEARGGAAIRRRFL